jgi:hypothetical protein
MTNPYRQMPDYAFWRGAVAGPAMADVDPVVSVPFSIAAADRVASAGSCFAQHISRYLRNHDFNYFVTEPAHPLIPSEHVSAFNYGTYTARFGNLYTARQLLQLFQRAYGRFQPRDDIWRDEGDALIDPFRPQIQPGGFASEREYRVDRDKHFAAVRRAFEELDTFVFTFGLTEAWRSREDGAVYPLCPGVAGGTFDPSRHEFHNFGAAETTADMLSFIDGLRDVNPKAKVILTVSPVPLIATAENRHVLVSTTYSKSVLRVACQEIVEARENVAYFPSYEIITGNFNRGAYFADDLRSVREEGVAHVMRLYMLHFAGRTIADAPAVKPAVQEPDEHSQEMERLVALNCEEDLLGKQRRARRRRAARG